ncbi:NAD(P)-binding protein [Auricularia subglabra TFB-10046 SS5]|nr:NAD(P)-binding protein [Auricularia subglabra TFB-10046 SS5]
MPALYDAQSADELFGLLDAGRFFDLSGLVAVITGGASGIGLMTATTLLANGAKVFIVDRAQKSLNHVLDVYKPVAGDRLVGIEADVSIKSEATRVAEAVAAQTAYVNVLFNNAGITGRQLRKVADGSQDPKEYVDVFGDYTMEDFNEVFKINTFAAYFFTVAFIPLLSASKGSAASRFVPQVINTCSINSWSKDLATSWERPAYQLSKGAIHHLTKILAFELVPLKIRVNGFAPGLFQTGMTTQSGFTPLGFPILKPLHWEGENPVAYGPDFKAPFQHLGRFEDISGLVLMFVTNHSIDGEIIQIDSGSMLRHNGFH